MNDKKEYSKKPYWNVYKPLKKDGAGAAFQFSYDADKRAIFLEAANQKGAKLEIGHKDQFDWEGKIVFKIGIADIAKLLPLFNGREKQATCLHSQQETGRTSIFEIKAGEYQGKPNFSLNLSRKMDGATQRIGVFLNLEELSVLAHFMRDALTRMFGY